MTERQTVLHLRSPLSTRLKISRLKDALLERDQAATSVTMIQAIDYAVTRVLEDLGRPGGA